MKLLNKLSLRYLLFSLTIMTITGGVIYFVLSLVIDNEMDEKLGTSLNRIIYDIQEHGRFYSLEPFTCVEKVEAQNELLQYSDTGIMLNEENNIEDFRELTAIKKIKGEYFKIILRESKLESKDLLQSLALITMLGFIVLTASLMVINRRVAKTIWAPFYENLNIVKKFSLNNLSPVSFKSTNIYEFDELNQVLTELTDKAIQDYRHLKQFSEDASHEIQTPLAIIKSKIETLLDNNIFNQKQTEALNSIYQSVHRLSRLNKDLILLTKIENKQFGNPEKINFREIIENKLDDLQELIRLKEISLTKIFNHDIYYEINGAIAGILINNLISNAIKYNIPKGELKIIMEQNRIYFYNSGTSTIKNPGSIFNRFYKESTGSGSVGLGLAIVKKICDSNHIDYQYFFDKDLHCFNLVFNF